MRKQVRACEYGRGTDVVQNISRKDGVVYLRLGCMLEQSGVTKGNYAKLLKIARWFCHNQSCLCKGKYWGELVAKMHVELKEWNCHERMTVQRRLLS